jgi:hypothetical protein
MNTEMSSSSQYSSLIIATTNSGIRVQMDSCPTGGLTKCHVQLQGFSTSKISIPWCQIIYFYIVIATTFKMIIFCNSQQALFPVYQFHQWMLHPPSNCWCLMSILDPQCMVIWDINSSFLLNDISSTNCDHDKEMITTITTLRDDSNFYIQRESHLISTVSVISRPVSSWRSMKLEMRIGAFAYEWQTLLENIPAATLLPNPSLHLSLISNKAVGTW